MELPLVDEIREARRLSEEASDAATQVHLVHSVLTSLAVLDGLRVPEGAEPSIPGEEVVDALAERWSQLGDIRSADPRPGAPLSERIRARRQQLHAALSELQPLADTLEHRAHHMSHLQEDQRELLAHPRYAGVVAELSAIGVERERYTQLLGPVLQRMGMVGPASHVLGAFEERISAEVEQLRMIADPSGVSIWRSLTVTDSLMTTAAETLVSLGLDVSAPAVVSLPEGAPREQVVAELDRVLVELRGLLGSIDAQREQLEAEQARVSLHLDALSQQLLDRLG